MWGEEAESRGRRKNERLEAVKNFKKKGRMMALTSDWRHRRKADCVTEKKERERAVFEQVQVQIFLTASECPKGKELKIWILTIWEV